MKKHTPLHTLLLIISLLLSQVSSAYIPEQLTQDCGMAMSMEDSQVDAEHVMLMQMVHDGSTEQSDSQMDCCEDVHMMTYCDSQCQCNSLVSSLFLFNYLHLQNLSAQSQEPTFTRQLSIHPPFLQLPKRPPIPQFS